MTTGRATFWNWAKAMQQRVGFTWVQLAEESGIKESRLFLLRHGRDLPSTGQPELWTRRQRSESSGSLPIGRSMRPTLNSVKKINKHAS